MKRFSKEFIYNLLINAFIIITILATIIFTCGMTIKTNGLETNLSGILKNASASLFSISQSPPTGSLLSLYITTYIGFGLFMLASLLFLIILFMHFAFNIKLKDYFYKEK